MKPPLTYRYTRPPELTPLRWEELRDRIRVQKSERDDMFNDDQILDRDLVAAANAAGEKT